MRPIGYLSPHGAYIKCSVYDHLSIAEEICDYNNWNYGSYPLKPADDVLLEHGFAHMTMSFLGKKEYHIFWDKFLTQHQKEWLSPIFDTIDVEDIPISRTTLNCWESEVNTND